MIPVCMYVCMTVAVDCGTLPNPSNGFVSLTTTTLGSTASYDCNNGFSLEGVRSRECQADGTWSGDEPSCRSKHGCCSNMDTTDFVK